MTGEFFGTVSSLIQGLKRRSKLARKLCACLGDVRTEPARVEIFIVKNFGLLFVQMARIRDVRFNLVAQAWRPVILVVQP